MGRRWGPICRAVALGLLLVAADWAPIGAHAAQVGRKPPVPTGRDPGGIGVALVGPGVDYTAPQMAARLARDGEGEIVGFDLIDGDRRPFVEGVEAQAGAILAGQSAHSRLMVFRADPSNQASMLQAASMAALSPAQIIVLDARPDVTLRADVLVALSERFKDRLVIVTVDTPITGPGGDEALAHVVTVRGCNTSVPACGWSGEQGPMIDVAVGLDEIASKAGTSAPAGLALAASIAALAARIWAAEPGLKGGDVKGRILALGRPFSDGQVHGTRGGLIGEPAAHLAGQ